MNQKYVFKRDWWLCLGRLALKKSQDESQGGRKGGGLMTESLGQPKAPTYHPGPVWSHLFPPVSEPHPGSLLLQHQVKELLVLGTALFLLPFVAGLPGSCLMDSDTKGRSQVKVC